MRIRSLLAALFLATAACDGPTDPAPGELTGQLNGESWRAPARLQPGALDEATIQSQRVAGSSIRGIGISIPGAGIGTYPIAPGGAWYYAAPRIGDAYTAEAVDGTITLTSVTEDEMRGTVEVTFAGPAGDEFVFTNGEFFVSLDQP